VLRWENLTIILSEHLSLKKNTFIFKKTDKIRVEPASSLMPSCGNALIAVWS